MSAFVTHIVGADIAKARDRDAAGTAACHSKHQVREVPRRKPYFELSSMTRTLGHVYLSAAEHHGFQQRLTGLGSYRALPCSVSNSEPD